MQTSILKSSTLQALELAKKLRALAAAEAEKAVDDSARLVLHRFEVLPSCRWVVFSTSLTNRANRAFGDFEGWEFVAEGQVSCPIHQPAVF